MELKIVGLKVQIFHVPTAFGIFGKVIQGTSLIKIAEITYPAEIKEEKIAFVKNFILNKISPCL